MAHEPVGLHEGAVVQQVGDALAGGLLPAGMLLLDGDLVGGGDRAGLTLPQVVDALAGALRPGGVGHMAS